MSAFGDGSVIMQNSFYLPKLIAATPT